MLSAARVKIQNLPAPVVVAAVHRDLEAAQLEQRLVAAYQLRQLPVVAKNKKKPQNLQRTQKPLVAAKKTRLTAARTKRLAALQTSQPLKESNWTRPVIRNK